MGNVSGADSRQILMTVLTSMVMMMVIMVIMHHDDLMIIALQYDSGIGSKVRRWKEEEQCTRMLTVERNYG